MAARPKRAFQDVKQRLDRNEIEEETQPFTFSFRGWVAEKTDSLTQTRIS